MLTPVNTEELSQIENTREILFNAYYVIMNDKSLSNINPEVV